MVFHIVHIVPDPKYHTLQGYKEVIETLQWGLESLGHRCTSGVNTILTDGPTNIILGAHMISMEQLGLLPSDSICYNLEQFAGEDVDKAFPVLRALASRFKVWDYCEANLAAWNRCEPKYPPAYVQIGWYPGLYRMPNPLPVEDIDILFYGTATIPRLSMIHELCQVARFKTAYLSGFYGSERDSIIARSKIVLNLNCNTTSRIFEIVRVSYLLANRKAVVADIYPNSVIEPDIFDAVALVAFEKVREECSRLLSDENARHNLEQRGQAIIERRDIRQILKNKAEIPANEIHNRKTQ